MTPASKSRVFGWWFSRHVERRLRSTFAAVYIRRLEETLEISRRAPILLVSNHSSWWDPMFSLYLVPRRMKLDGYAMMDEAGLGKVPFMRKLGGFGIDLSGEGAGRESLQYASELLDRPGRLVWIFPQGRERASTQRPLGFKRGSSVISLEVPGAALVPFGIRYEFASTDRPLAFLSFGAPLERGATVEDERDNQEAGVTAELETIDRMVRVFRDGEPASLGDFGFQLLLGSSRRRFEGVGQRLLAWVTKGRKGPVRGVDARHRRGEAIALPTEPAASPRPR